MKTKETKAEEKELGKWWILGIGIAVIVALIITAITIFWTEGKSKFNTEKDFLPSARVAAAETKTETEFPKIVTVGTEWKRIELPYCSWFDISPMDGNLEVVKIKLANNKEFTLFPNGELFYKGEKVPDFGKIPGVDIDIRATETSAKVIVSAGKKL